MAEREPPSSLVSLPSRAPPPGPIHLPEVPLPATTILGLGQTFNPLQRCEKTGASGMTLGAVLAFLDSSEGSSPRAEAVRPRRTRGTPWGQVSECQQGSLGPLLPAVEPTCKSTSLGSLLPNQGQSWSLDGLHLLANSTGSLLARLLYGFQVQTISRKKSYSCLEVTNLSPLCGQNCTFVSEPHCCPGSIGWQEINLQSQDAPPLSEVVLGSVGCTLH